MRLIWGNRSGMGSTVFVLDFSCHGHVSAGCVVTGWKRYLSQRCTCITRCFVLVSKRELSGWYSVR